MGIDFGKKEDRTGYLQTKLDDLLDGINASYGQALLDELMLRLEATVDDFNKEVDELMGSLKKSSAEKEKLIKKIKAGENLNTPDQKSDTKGETSDTTRELSEWEKKLEGIS